METIIVKPKNAEEAKEVLSVLKKMKIKIEVHQGQKKMSNTSAKNGKAVQTQKEKTSLFANSFGMWKDADITIESVRQRAWRQPL